jgi:hypothetical protein
LAQEHACTIEHLSGLELHRREARVPLANSESDPPSPPLPI